MRGPEHYTRSKLLAGDGSVKVYGALLGVQQGREIEITNSFEFSLTDKLEVDHGFFVTRRDQFKQVFPTYEIVGWYSTASGMSPQPSSRDLEIHQQLLVYNENPLFLQLTPNAAISGAKELPLEIFELVTEIVANEPKSHFIRVPYQVETGEAERVAVDHSSKPSGSGPGADSAYVSNLSTQRNALKMLHERIVVVIDYLKRLQQGTAPKDHDTLRQIAALTASLPAAESRDFTEEYMTEYSDVLLTSYLATLTKELGPFNDLVDRFHIQQQTQHAGGLGGAGGMRGDRAGRRGDRGGFP